VLPERKKIPTCAIPLEGVLMLTGKNKTREKRKRQMESFQKEKVSTKMH